MSIIHLKRDEEVLWHRVKRYVINGRETTTVDLKTQIDLKSARGKAEFIKDVTAIANSRISPSEGGSGTGYIIIGVKDEGQCPRESQSSYLDCVVGLSEDINRDELERQMNEILANYSDPPPRVSLEVIPLNEHKKIGVVVITPFRRPHKIVRPIEHLEKEDVFIRRETATARATPEEIISMANRSDVKRAIVLNLSSHPLTAQQKEELLVDHKLEISELIEVGIHFDINRDITEQIDDLLKNKIMLASDEWSSESVYIIPPGLSAPTMALLAAIHGLKGHFPKVIWIGVKPDDAGYHARHVIDLQNIRDRFREERTRQEVNP